MPGKLRLRYFAHSLRSDWNNGNAHFLRGLIRALAAMGHDVVVYEPCTEWSIQHLREEREGEASLERFRRSFPDIRIATYTSENLFDTGYWSSRLQDCDVVIVHERNPRELADQLLRLRSECGYRLLFHDTHHRASSSPQQIRCLGVEQFDGVLCFGESLREIYRRHYQVQRAYILHEAADTTIFHPLPHSEKTTDVLWIGNWGEGERTHELHEFFLGPAKALPELRFRAYGVRYPEEGVAALADAGVEYRGYLPSLEAPATYSASQLTVHIPRQQYNEAMTGIPTIRVFEALACGIPLISAPWSDTEQLFREGDYARVRSRAEMKRGICRLIEDKDAAQAQALCGLETILSRHTCRHRAEELTEICEDLVS